MSGVTDPTSPRPPLRVSYLPLGFGHYTEVRLPEDSQPGDATAGLVALVGIAFWDAMVGAFVYRLDVRPWRARRLYRRGVATPGRIVECTDTRVAPSSPSRGTRQPSPARCRRG